MKTIDKEAISNIRVLSMETITKAKSGHPGIALGAAPILYTLFSKEIKATHLNRNWINRDRFILAAGHGSSLLYVMLHLSGCNITIDDLKNFRQLNSTTPGHPELDTDGVDAASGPLGQGIPTAIGMSIASKYLGAYFNRDIKLFDNYIYVLCGDGDLQEGVTVEGLSLAGKLGLDNLIILYDSNDIQLDGPVKECNTENVRAKVEAMNLNYILVKDGENTDAISDAIKIAKESKKATLIEIKTVIGATSSKAGTSSCHGSPLSAEEVEKMRALLGGDSFSVSANTYLAFDSNIKKNEQLYNEYLDKLNEYKEKYPDLYNEYTKYLEGNFEMTKELLDIPYDKECADATRVSFRKILEKAQTLNMNLIGGAADLANSTYVKGINGSFNITNPLGRNICYGVREHAMGAITNGITLFGITRGFSGGFFVFSDYMKPAMRMAALMNLPSIFVFSHDSIAVGEDGPTHEPIEQLTMLRSIPNMNVIRPSGLEETKEAFLIAYNSKSTPTAIVLSRQGVKETRTFESSLENMTSKGAYVLSYEASTLDGVIIATGSEVKLAMDVKEELEKEGIYMRVVSMPSTFLFDKMPDEYKEEVLPKGVFTIALEMSDAAHMYKYVRGGVVYNIDTFGLSGKASDVITYFGFTTSDVKKEIKAHIKKDE